MSTPIWQKSKIFEKKTHRVPHDRHSRCSASTAKRSHGKFSLMNILTSNIFRPIKTLYVKSRFLRQIMATTKDGQFQRMTAVGAEHRLRWHGGPLLDFSPFFLEKVDLVDSKIQGQFRKNRKKMQAQIQSRRSTQSSGDLESRFFKRFPSKNQRRYQR